MKKIQYTVLTILITWIFNQKLMAQGYNKVFVFAQGDTYETEVTTNSDAIVKRGNQQFKIKSKTVLTKKYLVQSVNGEKVDVQVNIDKLLCNLDVNGKKVNYDSSQKAENTSSIVNGIAYIVHKPIVVSLNKYGAIQAAEEYKAEMATDTLLAFAGIQSEVFTQSRIMSFLADFSYRQGLRAGHAWTDNGSQDGESSTVRFVVDDVNEQSTILRFTSKVTTPLVNTNSTGTYVLDNATGMIKEKYIYTISIGYQFSAGNITYAVSRATNRVEKTRKL